MMLKIESPANARFKDWLRLTTGKGLKNSASFLLSGDKLVSEFLIDPTLEIEALLYTTKHELTDKMQGLPLVELSPLLFNELDSLGTHSPILVLKKPELKLWDRDQPAKGLELLCPLGDPQNVGALVRTAEAFGAGPVILLKEASNPFHPKAIKASAGAILRHPLLRGPSLSNTKLSELYGLDLNGTDIDQLKWPKNLRLVVGEEGPGIPKGLITKPIHIPMLGPTESLNASIAVSIALYSYSRNKEQA